MDLRMTMIILPLLIIITGVSLTNDGETMRSQEKDHERLRMEQKFLDMNRQIGKLTTIVKALTDKISNSKEGNNQDVLNSDTSTHSDSS